MNKTIPYEYRNSIEAFDRLLGIMEVLREILLGQQTLQTYVILPLKKPMN
jgi:hypothetical protein